MTQRTLHTFMSAETASGARDTYFPDYRFEAGSPRRTLQGIVSNGGAVAIYTGVDPNSSSEVLVSVFTSTTFNFVLDYPIARITAVKTSGAGAITLKGLV